MIIDSQLALLYFLLYLKYFPSDSNCKHASTKAEQIVSVLL